MRADDPAGAGIVEGDGPEVRQAGQGDEAIPLVRGEGRATGAGEDHRPRETIPAVIVALISIVAAGTAAGVGEAESCAGERCVDTGLPGLSTVSRAGHVVRERVGSSAEVAAADDAVGGIAERDGFRLLATTVVVGAADTASESELGFELTL